MLYVSAGSAVNAVITSSDSTQLNSTGQLSDHSARHQLSWVESSRVGMGDVRCDRGLTLAVLAGRTVGNSHGPPVIASITIRCPCNSVLAWIVLWLTAWTGDLRKKIEDQNGIFFDEQVVSRIIHFNRRLLLIANGQHLWGSISRCGLGCPKNSPRAVFRIFFYNRYIGLLRAKILTTVMSSQIRVLCIFCLWMSMYGF